MKKYIRILLSVILAFFCVFTCLGNSITANAETSTVYSDVLDDLEKDENFNVEDYPAKSDDYSLQVIQIAESTSKELFIYVYQPGNGISNSNFIASYINIATDEKGLAFEQYTLKHLDSTHTFSKYKVENFTVGTDVYRYYTISAIYRPWIDGVDDSPPIGTTISDVDYRVGRTWRVYYLNNELTYECKYVELVDIVNKRAGFVRYFGGFELFAPDVSCDSHYVAFSTDWDIDRLIDATLKYDTQKYWESSANSYTPKPIGEPEKGIVSTLSDSENVVFYPSGWFAASSHEWKRIQSAQEFVEDELVLSDNLGMTEEEFIATYDWVLRFTETEYIEDHYTHDVDYYYTSVTNVSIFRLHFIADGKVYNLGVVDNILSGDNVPDNDVAGTTIEELKEETKEWFEKLLAIILVVLLIVLLWPILLPMLKTIIKWIIKGIWLLIKGLLWILTMPFRLIFGGKKR